MANLTQMEIERQITDGMAAGGKSYQFDEAHDPTKPVNYWFQDSFEGETLFVIFYSQACRWSRCVGCNLPSVSSKHRVSFKSIMAQVDHLFNQPEILQRLRTIKKVIISNNGSILDEATFSTTALIYLIAKLNIHLPNMALLSVETRPEYVDMTELVILSRAIAEGETATELEIAIGFESFDSRIRNGVFKKGLELSRFEDLCGMLATYKFRLTCYFMQKPVPMSDEDAVADIRAAIDYLSAAASRFGIKITMYLNPTYVARGTTLERLLQLGQFSPPFLKDVARAALHAEGKNVRVFIGLSDEGLAAPQGSFIRPGDEEKVRCLESFNRSQDFQHLHADIALA